MTWGTHYCVRPLINGLEPTTPSSGRVYSSPIAGHWPRPPAWYSADWLIPYPPKAPSSDSDRESPARCSAGLLVRFTHYPSVVYVGPYWTSPVSRRTLQLVRSFRALPFPPGPSDTIVRYLREQQHTEVLLSSQTASSSQVPVGTLPPCL